MYEFQVLRQKMTMQVYISYLTSNRLGVDGVDRMFRGGQVFMELENLALAGDRVSIPHQRCSIGVEFGDYLS